MKHFVRSVIIFWGIVAIFPLISLGYSLFLNSDIYADLFGIGDGGAYVLTWLDENANGLREENEPPLANVCVWFRYRPESQIENCEYEGYRRTDDNGKWGEFLAGSQCDEIYIFAAAPDGFQPTTDLAYRGCDADFGFVKESVKISRKVFTIDEFTRREITKVWIRNGIVGLFVFVVALLGTKWLEKS